MPSSKGGGIVASGRELPTRARGPSLLTSTGDCSDEAPEPIVKSWREVSTRYVAAKNRFHFLGNVARRGRHHVSVGVCDERD
jgi:hypothetical protein